VRISRSVSWSLSCVKISPERSRVAGSCEGTGAFSGRPERRTLLEEAWEARPRRGWSDEKTQTGTPGISAETGCE
jgi:hypothetical protein